MSASRRQHHLRSVPPMQPYDYRMKSNAQVQAAHHAEV